MSDSTGITNEVVLEVYEKAQKVARIVLAKLAPEYGLRAEDLEIEFDLGGDFVNKVERGEKVKIICGMHMRLTDPKQFGLTLRRVLQFVTDHKMRNCVAMESVNTIKSRNEKYVEMYQNIRKSKLIPSGRLVYQKFTVIRVLDEVSKQAVEVTGKDGESIWELQQEAHIRISKKVLGE